MKNRNGFTLMELLVTITILGILLMLIIPNVLKFVEDSKKKSFIVEARNLYNIAKDEYLTGDIIEEESSFCRSKTGINDKQLELIYKGNLYYKIYINNNKILSLEVSNDDYIIDLANVNGIKLEDIKSNVILNLEEPISCKTTTPEIIVPESCFAFDSETGTITDYDTDLEECSKDLIIPTTINGFAVTSIGISAFGNSKINSVYIPDTITSIKEYAFAYNNLTSIEIPNTVTILEEGAFQNNKLYNINIPNTISKIEKNTFKNNLLTNIEIPSNITIIGEDAFSYNLLTNLEIPNTITTLETRAFRNNQIKNITIPNSISIIKEGVFQNNNISTLILPNTITAIESYGFNHNDLTSVIIPNTITSIGNRAFSMNNLTSIDIPFSVTNIGSSAFEYNFILQGNARIDNCRINVSIGENAFANNGVDGRTTITPIFLRQYAYEYTGGVQTFVVPEDGLYKIDLWGAQGGGAEGNGGYTAGTINLSESTILYIYVGGMGGFPAGGYNGGGSGVTYLRSDYTSDNITSYGGGGATDIRLVGGAWNDITSLRSRIIVAAGGGANGIAHAAGGLVGYETNTGTYAANYGNKGTQTSGGAAASVYTCSSSAGATSAAGFGFGSKGSRSAHVCAGGGGGSGYYGGSGSSGACSGCWNHGAGGSSFISGHLGCNAITETGVHTGQPNHFSGYVFTNTVMIDGAGYNWTDVKGEQVRMPKPDGTLYELGKGHEGNGYAMIYRIN